MITEWNLNDLYNIKFLKSFLPDALDVDFERHYVNLWKQFSENIQDYFGQDFTIFSFWLDNLNDETLNTLEKLIKQQDFTSLSTFIEEDKSYIELIDAHEEFKHELEHNADINIFNKLMEFYEMIPVNPLVLFSSIGYMMISGNNKVKIIKSRTELEMSGYSLIHKLFINKNNKNHEILIFKQT